MSKIASCGIVEFLICTCWLTVGAAVKPETSLPDIKLKGYLGERLDTMIAHHVIGTDVDYITACFQEKTERRGWWQTEFWGKYMHSAVPYFYYVDSSKLKGDLVHGVERILQARNRTAISGIIPMNSAAARDGMSGE